MLQSVVGVEQVREQLLFRGGMIESVRLEGTRCSAGRRKYPHPEGMIGLLPASAILAIG